MPALKSVQLKFSTNITTLSKLSCDESNSFKKEYFQVLLSESFEIVIITLYTIYPSFSS